MQEVPHLIFIQPRSEALTHQTPDRSLRGACLRTEVPLFVEELLEAVAELLGEFGECLRGCGVVRLGGGGLLRGVTWGDVAVSSHAISYGLNVMSKNR
jgi:hypothetical protein